MWLLQLFFFYLAGIHSPLQETSTDHPWGYWTTIHCGAGTRSPINQRNRGHLKWRRNVTWWQGYSIWVTVVTLEKLCFIHSECGSWLRMTGNIWGFLTVFLQVSPAGHGHVGLGRNTEGFGRQTNRPAAVWNVLTVISFWIWILNICIRHSSGFCSLNVQSRFWCGWILSSKDLAVWQLHH